MVKAAQAIFESRETERPIIDTAQSDLLELLNSNNYQKGAWVLHQLRGLTGDSAFYAGLRRYYTVYKDSTALSADFARIMSEISRQGSGLVLRSGADPAGVSDPGCALETRWQEADSRHTADSEAGMGHVPYACARDPGGWQAVPDRCGRQADRQVIEGVEQKPNKVAGRSEWMVAASGEKRKREL